MKKMLFALCVAILLAGCSAENRSIEDDFVNFLGEEGILELPSGYGIFKSLIGAEIEGADTDQRVIVSLDLLMDSEHEADSDYFVAHELNVIKSDLKVVGEKFIEYAQSAEMENDYYLYVEQGIDKKIVYDYEEDTLYVPKNYGSYKAIYQAFDSTDIDKISNTEKGVKFLVALGFGEIKHGVFERDLNFSRDDGTGVYIYEGTFEGKWLEQALTYR